MRVVLNILSLCLLLLVPVGGGLAQTASQNGPAEITAMRIGSHADHTRVVLELDRAQPYKIFILSSPDRVVVDMPEFRWAAQGVREKGGLVAGFRHGLFRPGMSRVVLDVSRPVEIQKHFYLGPDGNQGHRLVLDLAPVAAGGPQAAQLRAESKGWASWFTALQKADGQDSVAAAPAPNRKTSKKPMVILDAGHGGPDPGAIGVSGTYEKNVTLAVAKAVAKQLKASGRYRVRLTRDRDFYIPLRDRYRVAEESEADLFISLHADRIGRSNVRGASVYTLSDKASDKEAARLAAKENKSDLIAGVDLSGYDAVVARTLLDFEQGATMEDSWHFAEMLVDGFGKNKVKRLRNTHRFAGFAVLKSPAVPSVLVELGYLSNRRDEKLLRDPSHHKRIARAMLQAVDAYFKRQSSLNGS